MKQKISIAHARQKSEGKPLSQISDKPPAQSHVEQYYSVIGSSQTGINSESRKRYNSMIKEKRSHQ